MKHVLTVQRSIILFLAFYFFGGLLALPLQKHELFPVFSWFLFPLTPHEEVQYALRVYEYNNKVWNPPILFREGRGHFKGAGSIEFYEVLQNAGAAYNENNMERFNKNMQLLNAYLITPYTVEIVQIAYDPLQYWKTKTKTIKPLVKIESDR
ncbi:MAG TPA: hypothetical protein DIU37_00110 [Opitutae bacterium]|nr:hypothetical protein [Opitutae bacterium]|tara:strand:- start:3982 stop:4437 length:456 start_codon:yes stop_codon:yes gene_type:complete